MESKQLWVLGNFSRFIWPGMQRVEAIADSTPGADSLLISAWQDEANNKLVMVIRSEEHTSEIQSLMRISYAVFCWKKKTHQRRHLLYSTISACHQYSNN